MIVLLTVGIITVLVSSIVKNTRANEIKQELNSTLNQIDISTDESKDAFMEGCLEEAPYAYKFCECGYDYIKYNYNFADLYNMSQPKLDAVYAEIAKYCLN